MRRLFLLLFLLVPLQVRGQGQLVTAGPFNKAGNLYVCPAPSGGTPCPTPSSIFADAALTQPLSNPISTPAETKITFYIAPGQYTLEMPASGRQEVITVSASGAGPPGGNPAQTQVNDPGNPGHFGGTSCESFPSLTLGPANVDCDWHSKGPNPYFDITRFGARPCNESTTPCAGGLTASINSGSFTATISSSSTFINGDGVVIYGAGTSSGLSTPGAPTVTSVLSEMGVETDLTVPGATGATTKCYKIIARTTLGGYTPASPETCYSTGQATLGIVTVNLSTCTRSTITVTCVTSSATPLPVGTINNTTQPEVYIGGTVGTIDNSFRGWRTVTSATDSTHFTFVDTSVNTGNGAPTSTSGGTASFFVANHLSWTAVTGAWLYYIYGGATGAETLIGVSRPSDLGPNLPLAYTTWDDFTNLMGNFTFPPWIPTTPPVSGANNNLSTTIVSGAGTTTLTLFNSAGATVSGAGIRLDATPGIVAAAAASTATGVLYIPGGAAAGNDVTNFVINSFCDLTPYKLSVVQNGNISVHETLALAGPGLRYSGSTLSSGGTIGVNTWGSFPHFTVYEAIPGMYINNGSSNTVQGIQFQFGVAGTVIANGVFLALMEPGFNSSWSDTAFVTGSASTDLAGMGLMLRGQGAAAVSDTQMARITLTTGIGGANADGATHNTAFFCNSCGTTIIKSMFATRTGIIFLGNPSGATLEVASTHYNGGFTPFISTVLSTGTISLGKSGSQIEMDTIGHPCVAVFSGSPSVSLNGCAPSGYTFQSPSVTGGAILVDGGGVNGGPVFNNSLGTSLQAEVANGSSLIFNTTGPFGGISVGYNNDSIFVQNAPVAAPTCSVSAGGTVPIASYQFSVTPVWWASQNPGQYGINSPLSNVCTTTTGNQTITINWTIAPGNPQFMHLFEIGVPNNGTVSGGSSPPIVAGGISNSDFPVSQTSVAWSSGAPGAPVALHFPHGGATELLPGTQGVVAPAWVASGSGGGFTSTISSGVLTANRSVTWPNASGPVVLGSLQNSVYDNFNRANGAIGANWTVVNGTLNVSSNTIVGGSNGISNAAGWITTPQFNSDQFAQATVSTPASCGVTVRTSASALTLYVYWVDGANREIGRYINGTFASRATIAGTFSTGDVIRLEVVGTTLNAFRNGALDLTVTDSSITSGQPGVLVFSNGAAALDNWSGGNLHPIAQLDAEQDWTQPQHFTQPVTIGATNPVAGALTTGLSLSQINLFSGVNVATMTWLAQNATGNPLLSTSSTPSIKFLDCQTTSTCAQASVSSPVFFIKGGPIALSGGTIAIGSLPYASSTSYVCDANDVTATNAVQVVYTSGSTVTFNGTTTDSIRYICWGI